jgi:hypothetical protein
MPYDKATMENFLRDPRPPLESSMQRSFLAFATMLLLSLSAAHASVTTSVTGTQAVSGISFAASGGTPAMAATVSFSFGQVQNLSATCLGVAADVLSASGQADVLARMPIGASVAFDPAYTARVSVSPNPTCNFSFRNDVAVEVHTTNLVFNALSPYRLYKAPIGGTFRDITNEVLVGSVRTRGRGGAFSEFVVVKDMSLDYSAQASARFAALQVELDSGGNQFSTPQTAALAQHAAAAFAAAQSAFSTSDLAAAVASLATFESDVATLGNDGYYANLWQPGKSDADNKAGDMISRSANLRFLMGRLSAIGG